MANPKPRVIKNFEKLDEAMREEILALHPDLANDIVTYPIGGGRLMSALPYETEDFFYLIKFPPKEEMDLDDDAANVGGDDDMDLTGGVDSDDDEEEDDVETSAGSLQDLAEAEDED